MNDALLETRAVSVTYGGDDPALGDASLSFAPGEVTALIGPSGCGKSTFLRCLNLMNREIPRCRIDGSIYYRGRDINTRDVNLFELRQRIGMVFQQPNPFNKSIRDNIAFALKRHGMRDKHKLDEIVERSLVSAALYDEVAGRLDTSAGSLSGGQKQRLCIARTLAMDPDAILMDEPCSALDPIATQAIEETIASLAASGICVIIVTHNIEQARRISDRTAFFLMGEIVEQGPTAQVFEHPQDARTGDYLAGRFG